jgi:hypothetical protein
MKLFLFISAALTLISTAAQKRASRGSSPVLADRKRMAEERQFEKEGLPMLDGKPIPEYLVAEPWEDRATIFKRREKHLLAIEEINTR